MSRRLKYATFCSGIECMSVACRGLPLDPVFFSEIEPFPCAVLKANYPTIPNLGDMSKIRRDENGNITNGTTTIPFPDGGIDILAAGCPCQDFSVAGKRAGGAEGSGTRSSLIFEFIRIIGEIRPRWFIYENVVGMLSTNEGRDFAHILLALGDCGYSLAWRVLDAQYVRVDGMERAVPQRRRRVWVVGYSGADESRAAKILFEPDCVAGHTAPRRRTGEGFAYSLAGRDRVDAPVVGGAPGAEAIALEGNGCRPSHQGSGINDTGALFTLNHVEQHGVAYAADGGEVASTITRQISEQSGQDNRANAVVECFDMTHADDLGRKVADGVSPTLQSRMGTGDNQVPLTVSMAQNTRDEVRIIGGDGQIAGALPAEPGMKQQTYIVSTNSNGEDIAPTISSCEYKMGQKQKDTGGGYVVTRNLSASGATCSTPERTPLSPPTSASASSLPSPQEPRRAQSAQG